MTENDLEAIEARVQLRGTTRAPGIREQLDADALLAEVRRLRDMYADLVEAAQDIVACGADPVIVARLDACLARIDGRDRIGLFRPEGA